MNLGADERIVNGLDGGHRFGGGWGKVGSGVVLHLRRPFCSRNGACHSLKDQNPAQGELCHRHVVWFQGLDFLDGLEAGLVISVDPNFGIGEEFRHYN